MAPDRRLRSESDAMKARISKQIRDSAPSRSALRDGAAAAFSLLSITALRDSMQAVIPKGGLWFLRARNKFCAMVEGVFGEERGEGAEAHADVARRGRTCRAAPVDLGFIRDRL